MITVYEIEKKHKVKSFHCAVHTKFSLIALMWSCSNSLPFHSVGALFSNHNLYFKLLVCGHSLITSIHFTYTWIRPEAQRDNSSWSYPPQLMTERVPVPRAIVFSPLIDYLLIIEEWSIIIFWCTVLELLLHSLMSNYQADILIL